MKPEPEPTEETWFDADTALPKESRKLTAKFKALQTSLQIQVEQANAILMEFTTEPKEYQEGCKKESAVVQLRLEAARVVLGEGRNAEVAKAALDEYLSGFGRSSLSETSSSSAVVVAQANIHGRQLRFGPCPGFVNLGTLPHLLERAASLKDTSCKSNDKFMDQASLQAHVDSFELTQKAINELTKALKAACDQLYQSKLDYVSLTASADAARKKAATKRAESQSHAKQKNISHVQDLRTPAERLNFVVVGRGVTTSTFVFACVYFSRSWQLAVAAWQRSSRPTFFRMGSA